MKQNYFLEFLILFIVQLLICNYFHLTAYITLNILPCAILLMPTRYGTTAAMLLAFVAGLGIDFMADGVIGLNALALVPVAGSRRWICDLIFGKELVSTNEDVSMKKYGTGKMALAIMISQAIFLLIYILADGAESRTWVFNISRFTISLMTGTVLSLVIANAMDNNDRKTI